MLERTVGEKLVGWIDRDCGAPECSSREYTSCGARSLGRFKGVRSQRGKYHGISPAPKAAHFGNSTCLQGLGCLELVRKENDE